MAEPADAELSESDLATIAALSIVFDLVIGNDATRAAQIAGLFDVHIRHWDQTGKAKTAAILAMIKQRTTDPAVLEKRQQRLSLREPKGSAD